MFLKLWFLAMYTFDMFFGIYDYQYGHPYLAAFMGFMAGTQIILLVNNRTN